MLGCVIRHIEHKISYHGNIRFNNCLWSVIQHITLIYFYVQGNLVSIYKFLFQNNKNCINLYLKQTFYIINNINIKLSSQAMVI